MKYLPMDRLGARETSPKVIEFGIFLPGISSAAGYSVVVKIIHETDQYIQAIQPVIVKQDHSADPTYSDYWSGKMNLQTTPAPAGSTAWEAQGAMLIAIWSALPEGAPSTSSSIPTHERSVSGGFRPSPWVARHTTSL
ncbi:hypothetical protein [Acidisarcina polymorpha]|uniref:hypothetical protein n=1 Tax=Acidisarcina polymorpha TaxID=2211140 RepID=UPI00191C2FD0|nr:hypothetical protein [Acidisarcina polymorpha]